MHQHVTAAKVEAECLIAKTLGMEAVIIDDGWQTSDDQRGYAYTGDWEPCPEKFPNMKVHADAVHELGMKLLLWYAVPFVGKHSKAWNRFGNKLLRYHEGMGAGILDPRYPDVRDYIIGTYEDAIRNWDLDGFKLDFVDQFYSPERETPSEEEGRDMESIPSAVDRLLSDAMTRLRSLKPDVMIEFRQPYIGPAMRKYGNMFRASDCPNDAIQNRVRTIDIRLLSGETASHADMMMWHPEEPAESAALQLINSLFAVPQVSMPLAALPEDHQRMVAFWLGFADEHRGVLLGGKLRPLNPELLYPVVTAEGTDTTITAAYSQVVIPLNAMTNAGKRIIINGTRQEGLYVEANDSRYRGEAVILDCRGDEVAREMILPGNGIVRLPIPPAGVAIIRGDSRDQSQSGRK
jgi:alpha-galactosidase